jgi:hypothetical protein
MLIYLLNYFAAKVQKNAGQALETKKMQKIDKNNLNWFRLEIVYCGSGLKGC